MEIGISTASLFMRMYNEDALVLLNGLDARVCEIFLETFREYEAEYGELLAGRLGGLRVHSVHTLTLNFEPELFSVNPRSRGDAEAWFAKSLAVGRRLGATHYTMHGKARIKRNVSYDDFARIGGRLQELCEFSGKYGITLCLENVDWAYYNRPGFFRGVKRYAPDLKGVLDVKQARLSGRPYEEYLDEMGRDIATVHLSDVDRDGKLCLPGRGTFDFSTLFARLRDHGFDGDMLVEVYNDNFGDVSEFSDSLAYLRELKNRIFGKTIEN
ncbi:MAG: sugar phosphate isomerase/epimerase [Candidatus Borkfalkiaceae bacterium]|nr:sugar phosphate isomerase/epimerase [Christensenellaceae bacterium]